MRGSRAPGPRLQMFWCGREVVEQSTAPNNLFRVGSALARRAAAGLRRGSGCDQMGRRPMRLIGARRGPDHVSRNMNALPCSNYVVGARRLRKGVRYYRPGPSACSGKHYRIGFCASCRTCQWERHMSRRPFGILMLGFLAASSCTSYRLAPADAIQPKADIHVRMVEPQEVTFRPQTGPFLILDSVAEVRGRLIVYRGDSIEVEATSARLTSGASRYMSNRGVSVFATADVETAVSRVDRGKTMGIAALGLVAFIVGFNAAVDLDPVAGGF
jgi:hypothetical protein